MKSGEAFLGYTKLIEYTNVFIGKYYVALLGLGVAAGTGRFFQTGGQGEISWRVNFLMEVGVNLARLLTVLLVIGKGSIQTGIKQVVGVFRMSKQQWMVIWLNSRYNFSNNGLAILVNFIVFAIIAVLINVGLNFLFEYTSVLQWLKAHQVLKVSASKWPVLLFIKNISVIPFTLVFEILFLNWLVENKIC